MWKGPGLQQQRLDLGRASFEMNFLLNSSDDPTFDKFQDFRIWFKIICLACKLIVLFWDLGTEIREVMLMCNCIIFSYGGSSVNSV